MGQEKHFYLNKLKEFEYIFNTENELNYDYKLKEIVNKILYTKKDAKVEIDENGKVEFFESEREIVDTNKN